MTPERWKRTEELYHAARARAPGERAAFLAEACADDEAMRRDVESLLNEPGSDDGFLARPALVTSTHIVSAMAPGALAGRSLGGYQLHMLLGEGGMGEVYRAHDTTLGRDVAIKVLPPAFTRSPDRLARFEREARMLAALNHPNICGIYGLEDADGTRLLVLELVEGDTLAGRLERGSNRQTTGVKLPLRDALGIARQIADALEVAHEKGIVHRDLKPANVKITPDGVVKVLDFGLAKAVAGDGSSPDLTHAPETTPGEPHRGAVIGTAAYMSPEQARGLPVDKRTDIWAFGCVLYEMLTGRLAFPGDTASDSIAKILEREPDWSALPPSTPASVRRLLLRCLTKDPKQRLRDIGDVRFEIDAIEGAVPGAVVSVPARATTGAWRWSQWVAIVAIAGAFALWETLRPVPIENPLAGEDVDFKTLTSAKGTEGYPEISARGDQVAFIADSNGERDLFSSYVTAWDPRNLTSDLPSLNVPLPLRSMGFIPEGSGIWLNVVNKAIVVRSTSGGSKGFLELGQVTPAFSTSGTRMVFFDRLNIGDCIYLANSDGSEAQPLKIEGDAGWACVAGNRYHNHNMVWSLDDEWIYVVRGVLRPWESHAAEMDIFRIPSSGGKPEKLTELNTAITFLAVLDEDSLLYVAPSADGAGSWLWHLDIPSRTSRRALTGDQQVNYVSASHTGRVVYTKTNPAARLWTVPIRLDRDNPAVESDAAPFDVGIERALAPRFARLAEPPLLNFLSSRNVGDWAWGFSFESKRPREAKRLEGGPFFLIDAPAPSPDGTQVAVVVEQGEKRRLAIMNQDGTGFRTLVSAAAIDVLGAVDWSPDGDWIAAGGDHDSDGGGLFLIAAKGNRRPIHLGKSAVVNPVWSPGGDFIVYAEDVVHSGRAPLRAVKKDGQPYNLPAPWEAGKGKEEALRVSPSAIRFLNKTHLVYLPQPESLDFWLFNLDTGETRQITRLTDKGRLWGFDITKDKTALVFDRTEPNSDVVLVDLNGPAK